MIGLEKTWWRQETSDRAREDITEVGDALMSSRAGAVGVRDERC